jgi:sterol desaturase/sphingolipid hydroxylase (fatty acid hydroxylase superfamily)
MSSFGNSCLETLAWLAALAAGFGLLACFMPCNRGMYWWKDARAAGTDLLYWFVTPLLLRVGRTLLLAAGVAFCLGDTVPGIAAVQGWPLWQQCLCVLLIQDVILYWCHRLFHTPLAWKFHAVHHSSTVLDWMSSSRSHLINYIASFALADTAILLMGFSPEALLTLAPFNILYSSMVHANLNWTFGPLRYVFASPVFHRWHHTTQAEGIDKNFASTFPVLDLMFGTYYLPPDRLPAEFGIGEANFPDDFWGQFLYPFRKESTHDN